MHLHLWANLVFFSSSQLVFSILEDNTDLTDGSTNFFTLDSSSIVMNDDMPIIEEDLDLSEFGFSQQAPDQFFTLPSSAEEQLTTAAGESCPVGKKRDGSSCAAPLTLEVPSVLDVFGIGDGIDKSGLDSSSDTDVNTWGWNNVVDPCVPRTPYTIHLCCNGQLGPLSRFGEAFLNQCVTGAYCVHSSLAWGGGFFFFVLKDDWETEKCVF